jgi:hypothetical protein
MTVGSATYSIRVEGHLDAHWSPWLGEAELTREADGTTTVLLALVDQPQLHRVIAALRDIGVVLLELRRCSS